MVTPSLKISVMLFSFFSFHTEWKKNNFVSRKSLEKTRKIVISAA